MKAAPKRIEIKELPEGWIEITLNAAVENMKNGLYKPANEYAEHGVACLRMYNIDGGRIIWKNIKRMLLTSDEVHEYQLAPDDLLVNRVNSRELVGKTAVFPNGLEPCVYESKNIRVRLLSELVNSDCVNYQLLLFGQHHFNYNSQQVVGMASISQPQIGDFPLLVPPRIEQNRIVSKVQAMLAKLAKSRSHIANVAKTLKRFRQAVLTAACSGRLTADWREQHPQATIVFTEIKGPVKTRRGVPDKVDCPDNLAELEIPASWTLKSVADLLMLGTLRDIKDGNHGSNHPKTAELGHHGLPFITAAQVKSYKIDYENAPKITGQPLKRLKVGFAERGDVILTHKGTVGRAAVNTKPCVLTPQTTYYRCDPEVLDPAYLVYLLTSPVFYPQLAAVMSQTTRDFVPISEQYRLFLILPPIQEQREIGHRVDALFAAADKVQQAVQDATARTNRLTQSILARAFRGELVPTEAELARREGTKYEPASVLLERIKKERNSGTPSKATRQRTRSNGTLASAKGKA